ncbi:MAG: putative signal transducing protein [Armatimonadota bacterium]
MQRDEFRPIFNPTDEYQASIIKSVLEDEGIQTIIEPMNESSAFDGVIALAEGFWGAILVHESDIERATAILDEYSKNYIVVTEEESE